MSLNDGRLVYTEREDNSFRVGTNPSNTDSSVFGNGAVERLNINGTVTIPDEDNNKYTRFFIQFKAGTEDYILIDDISLTRSGDSKNYIDNADFETGNTNGWSSYGNNVSIFEMSNDTEGGDGGDVTYEELLENGDFENGELSSCYNVQNGGTTYEIKVDDAAEHGKVLAVTNPTTQTEDYESQFIFSIPTKAQVGEVYVFSMDIKSDTPATINTQAQSAPGTYMSNGIFGSISTTTEWTTITKEMSKLGMLPVLFFTLTRFAFCDNPQR